MSLPSVPQLLNSITKLSTSARTMKHTLKRRGKIVAPVNLRPAIRTADFPPLTKKVWAVLKRAALVPLSKYSTRLNVRLSAELSLWIRRAMIFLRLRQWLRQVAMRLSLPQGAALQPATRLFPCLKSLPTPKLFRGWKIIWTWT